MSKRNIIIASIIVLTIAVITWFIVRHKRNNAADANTRGAQLYALIQAGIAKNKNWEFGAGKNQAQVNQWAGLLSNDEYTATLIMLQDGSGNENNYLPLITNKMQISADQAHQLVLNAGKKLG